ncbi:anti-anti-sigma factor [Parafilimonas sp.]|uniref:anti-anti-sigma factor n=1 Tax=Parafilimonas sp. TaxID=1969739 RepID=UPI0039E6A908
MKVKIDTREKFTIITPESDFAADNLTAELKDLLASLLQHNTNLVINLKNISTGKENFVNELAAWQQRFYEQQVSFVICELQLPLRALVNQLDLDSELNITLTETEAWDMVQMEEIERELLGDE